MGKKSNRGKAIALIAAMVVLVAVVFIVLWPREDPLPSAPVEGEVTQMVSISTPYCELQYPDRWPNYFKHQGEEKFGIYYETFYCMVHGQDVELFRIGFGKAESDYSVGTLEVNGETIWVSAESADLLIDESWEAYEQDVVYAMAEGVNDVIESIQGDKTFQEVS